MSGIELLFRTAIDYERTHQIALFTLLSKSTLPNLLANISVPKAIKWEPEGQLFDLSIEDSSTTTFLELKMWAALSDNQFRRQTDFIKNRFRCLYILLGTSWFERSETSINKLSNGYSNRIGYDELIKCLNDLMITSGQLPEVYELTLAYRNSLQEQYDRIRNAYKSKSDLKLLFYSIYYEIQKRLKNMETAIYTVNNPGGPVYILNNSDYWRDFVFNQVSGTLYYEIVNGRLCIKFHTTATDEIKIAMRNRIREAIMRIYGHNYNILNSGRLGAYMSACQIDYDFTDINCFDKSAQVFQDIADKFDETVKAII
jgi:hypothetical protein